MKKGDSCRKDQMIGLKNTKGKRAKYSVCEYAKQKTKIQGIGRSHSYSYYSFVILLSNKLMFIVFKF